MESNIFVILENEETISYMAIVYEIISIPNNTN